MSHIPSIYIRIVNALCGLSVVEVNKSSASFRNKKESFVIHSARSEERKNVYSKNGLVLRELHCRIRHLDDKIAAFKSVGNIYVIYSRTVSA